MADASRILLKNGDAPPTPSAGKLAFYPRGNNFYQMDDTGDERVFGLPDTQDPAKYVVYVDQTFETNFSAQRFNKIQDAINWIYNDSGWYSELEESHHYAYVYAYPGKYYEQISSYNNIVIRGISTTKDHTNKSVNIISDGTSPATYPIQFNDGHRLLCEGIQFETESDTGIYGEARNMDFSNCLFKRGSLINSTYDESVGLYFKDCIFKSFRSGSGPHLDFYGEVVNNRQSAQFENCYFQGGILKCHSTFKTGDQDFLRLVLTNCIVYKTNVDLAGDWQFRMTGSQIFHYNVSWARRNVFGTSQWVKISNSDISTGIHFTANPSEFVFENNSFKDVHENCIPAGETDITSDVILTNAKYINNVQQHGLDGKIQIQSNTKSVQPNFLDSYMTLEDAFEAAQPGDLIQLDNGTFTGNFVLPDGVNLQGANEDDTILTSTSGTTLTLAGSGAIVSKLTVKTAPSGATIDGRAIQVNAGTHELQHCKIQCSATDTYGGLINLLGGSIELWNIYFGYIQSGATTGVNDHIPFTLHSGSLFKLSDSKINVDIADLDDNTYLIKDDTTEEINFVKNYITIDSESSGITAFIKQTETVYNNISYNHIIISGPDLSTDSGSGYCYLIEDDAGLISSVYNSITVTGFTTSCMGNIGANTTLKSHFDNIDTIDEVIGAGTYQYVNSPDPGNIRVSGAFIQQHENDVVVAKTGGDYTSIKSALASITDNDVDNRYNIYVAPGIYVEDNPIQCKSYITVQGINANTVEVHAQNAGSDLFTAVEDCVIKGMALSGTTSASLVNVDISGTVDVDQLLLKNTQTGIKINHADAVVTIKKTSCETTGVETIGTGLEVLAGFVRVIDISIIGESEVTTFLKVDGSSAQVNANGIAVSSHNVVNGIYIDNGGLLNSFGVSLEYTDNGFRIGSGGGMIGCQSGMCYGNSQYDLLLEGATAGFYGFNTTISRDGISAVDGANVIVCGFDGEQFQYRTLLDFSVGSPRSGCQTTLGDGGPYKSQVRVISYNTTTTTYTDITDDTRLQFPNLLAGTILYFGGEYPFYQIIYRQEEQKLTGGSIVWEYYDGGASAWVAFDTLNTLRDSSFSYNGSSFIGEDNIYQSVRFDANIQTGVTENNAAATGHVANEIMTSDGNHYWVRCRIVTNITQTPLFRRVSLSGNHSKFRDDGSLIYSGEARPIQSELVPFNSAITSNTILVSSNISYAGLNNELRQTGADQAIYWQWRLPADIDTSCGIQYCVEYYPTTSPSTNEVAQFRFTVANTQKDVIYDGTATEQIIEDYDETLLATDVAYQSRRHTMVKRIDISELSPGDIIWGKFHRYNSGGGDTYGGYIVVTVQRVSYTAWQAGKYI